MKLECLYFGTAGKSLISRETRALQILERLVLDPKLFHLAFPIREKMAEKPDKGIPANL